jgi:hypothetical protein
MYAEIGNSLNGVVDAGLAIANPNSTPATINFKFTNTAGTPVLTGNTTISGNDQLAVFLDQMPYQGPSPFQGTFSFTSTIPVGAVALRSLINQRGDFLMSTLPVVDATVSPNTAPVVVPHFVDGGGWTTQIFLVNPTATAMSGNVQFAKDDGTAATVTIGGQTASSFAYSVAAGSSFKLVTAGANAAGISGSVRIVPSGGGIAPTPLVTFSYTPAGITVSEAGVSATAGTAFRMYVELAGTSGQSGNIDSGVAIANNGPVAASVTLSLTDLTGALVGTPITISVPGSGHNAQFLEQFFAGQTLPSPFKGVLRISTSSSAGISVVGLRARYNERQPATDFLITTTPPTVETTAPTLAQFLLADIADGAGYTTQFVLFSGTASQSSIGTLTVYSPAGQPLNLILH